MDESIKRLPVCELSKQNLLDNLKLVRSIAPNSKIMAVVKANAYGHGCVGVSKVLVNEGNVDSLAVTSIKSAEKIRNSGINEVPIILIEGVFSKNELEVAAELDLSVVVHSDYQIDWIKDTYFKDVLKIWLKIDTGMGRLGFSIEDSLKIIEQKLKNLKSIQIEGIMSHFACADEPDHILNKKQVIEMKKIADMFPNLKMSFCNSAAIFNFPDMHYHWVRPGLALYGGSPEKGKPASTYNLKPVMTFFTEIFAIRILKPEENAGSYGSKIICPLDRNMRIGFAAAGYGDGYPFVENERGFVLLNDEKKCPIIGKAMMDIIAIDLSDYQEAKIGDKVTLWGKGLPVEEIAASNHHISYSLLANVQTSVKRKWI